MGLRKRFWRARFIVVLGLAGVASLILARPGSFPGGTVLMQKLTGKHTVADRLEQFGPGAEARWKPFFEKAGVVYAPRKLLLVGLKAEKRLEVYAQREGQWRWVRSLPVEASSGKMGPKLREGDRQVPEGFYRIESLNPNSAFHLSLRVSYPSDADKEIAEREGRTGLGGDIMIHGGAASVGCLAMGDEAAEDLFVLAAQTGAENIEVVLCPLDFRVARVPDDPKRPDWVEKRYAELSRFVQTLGRDSP